ncbi:MAG TPA: Ig-like domain-containing protein, partial [Chthoniobacterales bacterium]
LKPAPVTNGTWSTALPNNLGSGGYDLYVKAVDKADNDSEFAQSHFIVDPTGPTIVISEPQNEHNYATAPQASGVAFDNITKKSFALFREDDGLWFNWNANSFDNATFNGSAHVKVLNETGSAWTLNLPSVSPGVYELHALATDTSGRSSDWVRRDFRVDRPPVVRVTSPAHGSGIQDLGTITGEVEDPSGEGFKENEVRFTLYCDGQYWTGSAWTSTQEELYATVHGGSWSYVNVPTGANERAGEYFISANVEDRTGAKSVPTPGVNQTSFRIDRDPPQVAISSPAHGSTITAKNFQFRGTASDVGGIQAVNVFLRRGSDYSYWNGSGWGSAPVVLRTDYNANTGEWVNVSGLPVLGGNSTSQMANGTYNFIAIAIDAAGNFQQTDSVVTVDYHKVLTWTGGFSSNWDDAANWTSPDGGSVPDASAVAIINNGAHIQSGQSRTLYELRLSSGFLDFTGANRTLTTTKKTTWTGGAFRGIWDNAPGAILEMSGTAVKHISDGAVFNNRGLVTWDGPGTIQAEGNGFVDNPVINNKSGGIFEIKGGGGLFSRASGRSGVPVFNNEAGARFLKSGGVGPLVIDTFHFNNVGEMRCDSGAIAFNTAAQFINAASLRGAGRFELQGGSLTLTGNLVLEETIFRVDLGDFVGAANGSAAIITVGNALFEGRGGRFFNKLTLTEGSRMHLTDPESGPNPKFFGDGLTLNNYGLIIWTGGGKILAQGDGFTDNPVFNNKSTGRFESAADG